MVEIASQYVAHALLSDVSSVNDVQYLECQTVSLHFPWHVSPVGLGPLWGCDRWNAWFTFNLCKTKDKKMIHVLRGYHLLSSGVWRWSNVRRLSSAVSLFDKKDSAIYMLYKIKEDIWSRSSLLIFILRLIRFCSHGLFLCSLPVLKVSGVQPDTVAIWFNLVWIKQAGTIRSFCQPGCFHLFVPILVLVYSLSKQSSMIPCCCSATPHLEFCLLSGSLSLNILLVANLQVRIEPVMAAMFSGGWFASTVRCHVLSRRSTSISQPHRVTRCPPVIHLVEQTHHAASIVRDPTALVFKM